MTQADIDWLVRLLEGARDMAARHPSRTVRLSDHEVRRALLTVKQMEEERQCRAGAAEKRVKELEPIVTMREQELMWELERERGLVQLSHKRETAMRGLLMRFIPADRHEEVRAALEAQS